MTLVRLISSVYSPTLLQHGLLYQPALTVCTQISFYTTGAPTQNKEPLRKAKTPQGRFDTDSKDSEAKDVYKKFPDNVNPQTKEKGGPTGPEPTRYGDWERKGRCIDF